MADQLTTDLLSQDLTYISKLDSITRTIGCISTLLFNHQPHHSGQISAILHQMGFYLGATDLPAMFGKLNT